MKNRSRKSSMTTGIFLSAGGGIFTALGIAMSIIIIKGLAVSDLSEIDAGILMPIVLILALFGFGITILVMGCKQIYFRIKQSKTYRRGQEATARIGNAKSAFRLLSHWRFT